MIIKKDKITRYIGGIFLQGGTCDRCVETILERRQTLIHPTLAGEKNDPCANPYPIYACEGLANPYQYYVGGASQTLIHPMLARDIKDIKNDNVKSPEIAA